MKLLYFAWIRVKMGVSGEQIDPPQSIKDIEGLLDWIKQRNSISNETFSDISNIRIAVNQEYVDSNHPVQPGDEIAFFPPMTGG
jgi:molybdopterin synthase sulfur carrier subunit